MRFIGFRRAPVATLPAVDSTRWVVLNHGREAGDLVVTTRGDTVVARWMYTDRQRGTFMEARWKAVARPSRDASIAATLHLHGGRDEGDGAGDQAIGGAGRMFTSNGTVMTLLLNSRDYETQARETMSQSVYDYYAGGAGDEITVRENELAWKRMRLVPRMLVDVSACDLRTTVLGAPISMPIMTAPCALNCLAHPDGELAVARAVAAEGTLQVLSTLSSVSLQDVAQAAHGERWFQLYVYRDREITRALVHRAEAAGYTAICLTVDVQRPGLRERDYHNNFSVPATVRAANFDDAIVDADCGSALLNYMNQQLDPALGWEVLEWLRSITVLPVVVKGILSPDDARLAVLHGAAGIAVSNHGGRQLDTVVSSCDALEPVVDAVDGAAEVYVDGGIRRGTDVMKALALGARAVLVGRPDLWGLAVDGERGVRRVLTMLREDLALSMALAGTPRIPDVTRSLLATRASFA